MSSKGDPQPRHLRWFQRPAYIAALAGLIASIALGTLAASNVATGNDLDDQGAVLDRIDRLAVENRSTLDAVERNQAGTDELVAFVRDLQSRPEPETDDRQMFVDLLCASEDPVRLAACEELGAIPKETQP